MTESDIYSSLPAPVQHVNDHVWNGRIVETAVHENFSSYTNKPAMSSDEDDRTDTDDSSVTTDYDDFSTSSEDDEEDGDDAIPQPVHFRECLRLLDAALAASNPPILPPWCASEQIDSIDDPMLSIDGREACLNLPLSKQDAGRLRRKALPLDMKIDLLDGVSVRIVFSSFCD